MAQSLFDLQRIWDAWPSLKNQQVRLADLFSSLNKSNFYHFTLFLCKVLRDLFRKLSSDSPAQELKISNVFVVPGHIFVAVSSKEGTLPKGKQMYSL